MKIILGFLFVILSSCGSRPSTPVSPTGTILTSKTFFENIIGTTIKIGNLEVAQYDFPKEVNWNDANEACTALGEGWRLPDNKELNILYQNKNKIGGFVNYYYWSLTEEDSNIAYYQNFNDSLQYVYSKVYKLHVRAVRSF